METNKNVVFACELDLNFVYLSSAATYGATMSSSSVLFEATGTQATIKDGLPQPQRRERPASGQTDRGLMTLVARHKSRAKVATQR